MVLLESTAKQRMVLLVIGELELLKAKILKSVEKKRKNKDASYVKRLKWTKMQKIVLEIADNGIIKTVSDDNINAAGERFESKVVYDIESGDVVLTKMNLLYELSEDMGLELGNSKQVDQIKIISDWGDSFEPSKEELEGRISEIEIELNSLKESLSTMKW